MDLDFVMNRLYESEINCSISSFWDDHWTVKLGDEMNGFVARCNCESFEEAAEFLDREARKHFPTSLYTLGQEEYERQNGTKFQGLGKLAGRRSSKVV